MKTSVLCLLLVLVIASVVVPLYLSGVMVKGETQLRKFSSYEALKNFLRAHSGSYYSHLEGRPSFFLNSPQTLKSMDSLGTYNLSPDYSKTNIQVEGVDEADIIKTDGQYIYIASGRNLTILKAYPPEEAQILSQVTLNQTIGGLFVKENKMVIFEDGYYYYGCYETFVTPVKSYPSYGAPEASVRVYDITDKSRPISTRNVTWDGYYFDSRMIGDYVYAVINEPVYANETWAALPRICVNGEVREIGATEIYYSNVSDYFNVYTTIVAINIQDDAQEPTHESILLGGTSTIYVSMNNIYITFQGYSEVLPSPSIATISLKPINASPTPISPPPISPIQETVWGTNVHRIHIENGEIDYVASGEVPGHVLNQFSIDEYNGYFRIATTTGEVWGWEESLSKNHVYVLDMNLDIVGRLEDLAPGEKIYSARFMGNRFYLVTFKKIDPLFVIDLSNPYYPKVLGELKVTGYSDYMHPYDENHIIGIGKETIEDESGDFAWYQGVKISLFDISNATNPQEIDKYIIGDRGTESPVLDDHKAFLFDRSKNLLVIPVSVAERPSGVPPWTYGTLVFQGAYVFNITLNGFVFRGRITHSPSYVERSLYIDNVLYTISGKKIKMNSLETLEEINEIELP